MCVPEPKLEIQARVFTFHEYRGRLGNSHRKHIAIYKFHTILLQLVAGQCVEVETVVVSR